jgi:hypothetical protein
MSCRSLYSIKTRCFDLRDISSTSSTVHGPICSDLHCGCCRETFRVFSGKSFTFAGKVKNSQPVESMTIPDSLTPFISHGRLRRVDSDVPGVQDLLPSDLDFEVMFTRRDETIVGSVRHSSFPGSSSGSGWERG